MAVKEVFDRCGITGIIDPDMIKGIWFKFMCNVGENLTCALLGIPFGAFQRSSHAKDVYKRQLEYRSKKELDGDIRIVTVPGADVCACCGTHVKRTGEIGPIKVTSSEHYKSGIRLTLQIGWMALGDYDRKQRNVKAVSNLLSAKPEEIGEAVQKQLEQMQELKQENIMLKQRIFDMILKETPEGQEKAVLFEKGLNSVEVRRLADMLSSRAGLAAVFSGSDSEGYKYVVCSVDKDVAALGKLMNQELNGRGGGKNPMIQGSVQAEERMIRKFFEEHY